jgi:hypothetical protein
MEQMIVILVFAFCAAVCVKLIAEAHLITTRNNDVKNAIIAAESGAECFKAYGGDMGMAAAALGGSYAGAADVFHVYYDSEWRICREADSVYIMSVTASVSPDFTALLTGHVTVTKNTGAELLSLPVNVARNGGPGYE